MPDDVTGATEIDGADIPGSVLFTRDYYQPGSAPANPGDPDTRLDYSQIEGFPDTYLKTRIASQSLEGTADLGGNSINGANSTNGFQAF